MKKYLLIAFILALGFFKSDAQSFTLSELIALQKQNFDDKEDTILSKGFESSIVGPTVFTKDGFVNSHGVSSAEIIVISYDSDLITYSTISLEAYKKVKLDLKSLGFKFTDTFDWGNDATKKRYKKRRKQVALWQNTVENTEVLYYNIQVHP